MTGILEQILADVQALRQEVAALRSGQAAPAQQYVAPAQLAPAQLAPTNTFAGVGLNAAPVQQQPPANVTDAMILELIQPHLGNDALKSALGDTMRGMGIATMQEIQPHQNGAVYAAFQQVLQRFGIGGAQAAPAQPQSII